MRSKIRRTNRRRTNRRRTNRRRTNRRRTNRRRTNRRRTNRRVSRRNTKRRVPRRKQLRGGGMEYIYNGDVPFPNQDIEDLWVNYETGGPLDRHDRHWPSTYITPGEKVKLTIDVMNYGLPLKNDDEGMGVRIITGIERDQSSATKNDTVKHNLTGSASVTAFGHSGKGVFKFHQKDWLPHWED